MVMVWAQKNKMVNGYNKNSLNSLLLVRFDLIKEKSSEVGVVAEEKVTSSLSVSGSCAKRKQPSQSQSRPSVHQATESSSMSAVMVI